MSEATYRDAVTVEWGDCDEAGIVFYPNYFYWFDCGFQRLLRGRGLSQRILRERFGAVTPILRAEAEFVAPARYDDVLAIVAHVEQWEARRFRVTYTLSHDDRPIARGFETRAWATVMPDGRLKGAAIAAEFRSLLESQGIG
jgi:YbgC/YbaW family acyl-CoA thioester hydrolase